MCHFTVTMFAANLLTCAEHNHETKLNYNHQHKILL